jgi:hypothetical protein
MVPKTHRKRNPFAGTGLEFYGRRLAMSDRRSFGLPSILLAAAFLTACHDGSTTSPPPASVRAGAWGGSQTFLAVSEGGGVWKEVCANGSIDHPMTLDPSGRFDVTGTLTRGVGGPSIGRTHPARYTGTTDGRTLTITIVTTDDNAVFGPFTLAFGQQTQVGECPLI